MIELSRCEGNASHKKKFYRTQLDAKQIWSITLKLSLDRGFPSRRSRTFKYLFTTVRLSVRSRVLSTASSACTYSLVRGYRALPKAIALPFSALDRNCTRKECYQDNQEDELIMRIFKQLDRGYSVNQTAVRMFMGDHTQQRDRFPHV